MLISDDEYSNDGDVVGDIAKILTNVKVNDQPPTQLIANTSTSAT